MSLEQVEFNYTMSKEATKLVREKYIDQKYLCGNDISSRAVFSFEARSSYKSTVLIRIATLYM